MGTQTSEAGKLPLRRVMRGTEYFTLAFGSIVGVGWMVLLEDWYRRGGPVGAMLGFLIGGVALGPVAYVYGRLAERIPEAGSEVAYTAAVFPRAVSFAAGWALALTYLMVLPWEAVAMGRIAAYSFPLLNRFELYQVAGEPIYLPHLVIALATIAGITLMNYRGARQSSAFQNLTTFGLLAIFLIFAPLGLSRGDPANLSPAFADEPPQEGYGGDGLLLAGIVSTLQVMRIVPYYLMGFETIPKCAEEAAEGFSGRRFLPIMFLALGAATVFYVTIAGVVALLFPWQRLLTVPFATAVAFEEAFGWAWLVHLMMFGVVLSLLKVANGNFLAATRLLYGMAGRDLLGRRLGTVHAEFRTPATAIIVVGSLAAVITLLGRAILVPITEVGSFTCAIGWLSTCLAFCGGAGGRLTWRDFAVGLAAVLVATLFIVIVAHGFGLSEWLTLAAWATLGTVLWLTPRWRRGGRLAPSRTESG
jgi:amino acid transporter